MICNMYGTQSLFVNLLQFRFNIILNFDEINLKTFQSFDFIRDV